MDPARITSFEWEDNARPNKKLSVAQAEAEEVFFNRPLLVLEDPLHRDQEARLNALGKSLDKRALRITITLRGDCTLIWVIFARVMQRKERSVHDQAR